MDVAETPEKEQVGFKSHKKFLSDLGSEVTARVITSAADVALVINNGVVKDVALGNPDLASEGYDRSWRGKPWVETVTIESKTKITDLLENSSMADVQWRQVNHPSRSGLDVPIKYTIVKTDACDTVIALGRDLRSVSVLQQRLVETHQNLEREYSRMRETEARYRLLFESTAEAVVIVDAYQFTIEEINPAAKRLLGGAEETSLGTDFFQFFPTDHRSAIERLVGDALEKGRTQIKNISPHGGEPCTLLASAFRQNNSVRLIIRLLPASMRGGVDNGVENVDPFHIARELPDGLVVTTADLQVIAANPAFLKMTHLTGQGQANGEGILNWLGRSSTELNVLVSSLKAHGMVRNFSTVLRDRFGVEDDVELSAVSTPGNDAAKYCFSIRSVARRMDQGPRIGEALPSTVEQVTGLVGRMPLRDIVRESTDLIEKLCIETALDLAGDNRVSAADILGLSRQGLYSKLKRFEIGD